MRFLSCERKMTMTGARRSCDSHSAPASTVCTAPPLDTTRNVTTRIRQYRKKWPGISRTSFLDVSWRAAFLSLFFWKHQQQGVTVVGALEATQANKNNNTFGVIHEDDRNSSALGSSSNDGDTFMQQHHRTQDDTNHPLPFFELHPTAVLAVERQRRRLSRRHANNNNNNNNATTQNNDDSNTDEWWKTLQKDWFHPNTNAVYATLPKKEDYFHDTNGTGKPTDSDDDDLILLEDFHRFRHLSRYEREYRLKAGLDLQPHWDGIYDDFDDNNADDDGELENDVPGEDLDLTDSPDMARYERNVTNAQETSTDYDIILRDDERRNRRRLQRQSSSSTHFGGRFNNYQGVALSQGYGTHYANAWVGSPTPQRKTLIVDTGSHYTGTSALSLSSPCS